MSNELVIQDDFSKQLAELDKIQDTCKKLLATKHYQTLGEAGIHAIIARSKALGIHPFEALNGGFHCINGKVGMSTEMMAALIRRRGHSYMKDPKSTDECIIIHGKIADNGDTWTCTFSKKDAEIAGLWNGPTWKKYPGIMLYNRCMSMLFRQLFPDLSMGAGYVEDELKEIAKVDEYKLTISECEVVKTINNEENKTLHPTVILENRDELITQLKQVLKDCGEEYEDKIVNHYKILSVDQLLDKDLKMVLSRSQAFREIRMKQNESNSG